MSGKRRIRLELTPDDRIAGYKAFSGFPNSLFLAEDGRIVGTWVMGNDYRVKSGLYGGYPPTYLRRIKTLFPDKRKCLHLFSGAVNIDEFPGITVDISAERLPDYVDDAHTLNKVPFDGVDLVLADPPYSVEDADHYKAPMINRNKVMATLAEKLQAGAHLVWLDQALPMYRKDQWKVEGYIGMVKSTNHRFRMIVLFRRLETPRRTV